VKRKHHKLDTGLIPKDAVKEFKQIYLKEHGIELTDEAATEIATRILNLVQLLTMKPVVQKQEKL
jgi:hypothetical protein